MTFVGLRLPIDHHDCVITSFALVNESPPSLPAHGKLVPTLDRSRRIPGDPFHEPSLCRFSTSSPSACQLTGEEKLHAQYPGLKVLSYTSKYKNLQVENGLACEWFEKKAEYKLSPESVAPELEVFILPFLT